VVLRGTSAAQVQGNLIGTDITGRLGLGGTYGIRIVDDSRYSIIGGDRFSEGNVISDHSFEGIRIEGSDTSYNRIWGNLIGVNGAADGRLPNGQGGIRIEEGHHNDIGHADDPLRGNIIGGNSRSGIHLRNADQTSIARNFIGTDPHAGRDLGNVQGGIVVWDGCTNTTIGPRNVIAFNQQHGVAVMNGGGTVRSTTITENSITNNEALGIAREGDEPLPPIITGLTDSRVQGITCSGCRVEVFSDPDDEGERYHGATTAAPDGTWWLNEPGTWEWPNVHATTTDDDGNTSEFSTCMDSHEPNDTFDDAAAIELGEEVAGEICYPWDVDTFALTASAGSVLSVEFETPLHARWARLTLFRSDGLVWEQITGPGTVAHLIPEDGVYYVQVESSSPDSTATFAYSLQANQVLPGVSASMWLDEGRFGSPYVYKLIPDGPGGWTDMAAIETYVDIELKMTSDSVFTFPVDVDLYVPDDRLGELMWVRERLAAGLIPDSGADKGWTEVAPGHFHTFAWLEEGGDGRMGKRLLFRFAIQPDAPPGEVLARSVVSLRYGGATAATPEAPPVHLVRDVDAIMITSRRHLYSPPYAMGDAVLFLSDLTVQAQGGAAGVRGALPAAIYYVDDYDPNARTWDNTSVNYASMATANVAHDAINWLLLDWVDDAASRPYALIVGDDDVVPMRRVNDCRGTEAIYATGSPAALAVMSNGYYLSDSMYADLDGAGISRGQVELILGRLVGDSIDALHTHLHSGLTGPSFDPPARAVLACDRIYDLHFRYWRSASVLLHVRDSGYSAGSAMVDNNGWDDQDLLAAMATPYSLMLETTHSDPYGISGAGGGWINGVTAALSSTISLSTYHPFYGFGGCQLGYTLVWNGFIDHLAGSGASGVLAVSSISAGGPKGHEWYNEEVLNRAYRRMLPAGDGLPVGHALRNGKRSYSARAGWRCLDQKAVQSVNLFGVPWTTIPRVSATAAAQTADGASAPMLLGEPAFHIRSTDSGYVLTQTLDASHFDVDRDSAPGFDLVQIEGFEQGSFDGVVLPSRVLEFRLPPEAVVTSVTVHMGDELSLGRLNIPTYIPAVPVYPDGTPEQWLETPGEMGVLPGERYTTTVKALDWQQLLHVSLAPLSYNAASDEATLHQEIEVTVAYTSPTPLSVQELRAVSSPFTPGALASVQAEISNAGDQDVEFTLALNLHDLEGTLVAGEEAGSYTVPAGATLAVAPTFFAPQAEGSYRVDMEVRHEGQPVAYAMTNLQVLAGQIAQLAVPERVLPGETVAFTLTYANAVPAPMQAEVTLSLVDALGRDPIVLPSQTVTMAAQDDTDVTFTWDSRGAAPGRYQVLAEVAPGSLPPRRRAELMQVWEAVYLPVLIGP
jgi:hypothetical protein